MISAKAQKKVGFIFRMLGQALRIKNQTGTVLLFIPGLWSFMVAQETLTTKSFFLFLLGCFWTRSLGCLYNDWIDRRYDRHVARTCTRAFVRHSPPKAFWVLVGILVAVPGLFFLSILAWQSQVIGILGGIGTLIYPFLKRFFFAPQIFLAGLFNLSVWMAPTLGNPFLPFFPFVPKSLFVLLFVAGILWTIEYDTVYAYQDVCDDQKIGLHSLAVTLKKRGHVFLIALQFLRYFLFSLILRPFQGSLWFVVMLWSLFFLRLWKLNLEDKKACTYFFKTIPLEGFLWALLLFLFFSV